MLWHQQVKMLLSQMPLRQVLKIGRKQSHGDRPKPRATVRVDPRVLCRLFERRGRQVQSLPPFAVFPLRASITHRLISSI